MSEVDRVRTHLLFAELELRLASTRLLTDQQRRFRLAVIAELARYRERGQFPRNLVHAAATPHFIDDRGIRCAMAHLIEVFGAPQLVARVAASANTAYVAELADDPDLQSWLVEHGLTVAEAAAVQPTYLRGTGLHCDIDARCESGRCIVSVDDPELSYCTETCTPSGAACPVAYGVAMQCTSNGLEHLCTYPAPTPGTFGSTCDPSFTSCRFYCLDADGDGTDGVCTHSCDSNVQCPSDLACIPDPGTYSERVCGPRPSDGCQITSADAGAALLLLLFALARSTARSRSRSCA
jgi:hypothetical protein